VSRFDADQEIIREYHRVLEGQQAFESRIREVGGIEEWWRQFRAKAGPGHRRGADVVEGAGDHGGTRMRAAPGGESVTPRNAGFHSGWAGC
jgi:hypothetical protein